MDTLSDFFIELIHRQDNPIGLAVIALCAMVEYIFPPFPGDTVTLFAAVLITAYGWSFIGVFLALMTGSVAGSMAVFAVGVRLHRRRQNDQARDPQDRDAPQSATKNTAPKTAPKTASKTAIDRLIAKFHRRGAGYLVINRFLPGVRSLIFLAAGMAGMRPLPVLLYSALSAAVWNLGLIAAGSLLGANFDTLLLWMKRYTTAVWLLLGGVLVVFVLRALWRRRHNTTLD